MNRLSHGQAKAFVDVMTDAQLARVMNRFRRYSGAFPDIRDAVAQAVADELDAILANLSPRERAYINQE